MLAILWHNIFGQNKITLSPQLPPKLSHSLLNIKWILVNQKTVKLTNTEHDFIAK